MKSTHFIACLGFSKMGVFDKQPEMLVRMTADYGSRSEVVLPDSSVVKLNSGSDITYSYNAKEKIREVNFQGEGFFDVSKNKIPFVIKMNNGLRLKVHGTSLICKRTRMKKQLKPRWWKVVSSWIMGMRNY